MKKLIIIIIISLHQNYFAQEVIEPIKKPFYFGLGLGMDFGGIGGKVEYMFLDYAGLFAGVGYNFYGLGFNGGVMLKAAPFKKVTPYVLGMYGYTGVVVIENASNLDRVDYGPSLGGGLEIKTKAQNAWQIGLVFPFRSEEFKNHYESLEKNPMIQIDKSLRPIAFTVGYKMVIR